MSPSRSARRASARPGQAGRNGRRPPPRRRRAPLIWAGVLVALLAVAAVVMTKPGSERTGQPSTQRRETAAVTVRGEALPPLPQDPTTADPAIGRRVPLLSGVGFDGRPMTSAADGKPQVLIFLAHWCPHCRNEVPLVTGWLGREGLPAGVDLVSVSTGTDSSRPNYPPSSWLERERWPLPVLLDNPPAAPPGRTA